MTQPKNFGFGDDEKMLRESARKFFTDNSSPDQVHKLVAGDPDPHRDLAANWDSSLWQQMVELGWASIAVPERAGGMGMPAVAAIALVEESGRAAYVGPLLSTLCATYVLDACNSANADVSLGQVIEGRSYALAIGNQEGVIGDAPTASLRDGKLNGEAFYVQDPQKCDSIIVSALDANEKPVLVTVEKSSQGVTLLSDAIVDLTRDQGRILFADVSIADAQLLCESAGPVLKKVEPIIATLLAADMVGAAEWQLQTTNEYAKTREQFGRPIGFFQAVKHPLVDMMVMIDQARGLTYNAACAWDHEPESMDKFSYMAKASAAEMAIFCSNRSIQLHGGIGFTWECYLHLYFKRQMHSQMLFGDATYYRAKLAGCLFGDQAA